MVPAEILLMARAFKDWPESYKLASPDKKTQPYTGISFFQHP
jgi:hypothetical protein